MQLVTTFASLATVTAKIFSDTALIDTVTLAEIAPHGVYTGASIVITPGSYFVIYSDGATTKTERIFWDGARVNFESIRNNPNQITLARYIELNPIGSNDVLQKTAMGLF
jgi:hypothetical protein